MLLGRRLMVGQEILVLFIMVRIRTPQPKFQNLPTGASFLLFSNIFCKFESYLFEKRYFYSAFELFMI